MLEWARGAYDWARTDERLAGLAPWHYYSTAKPGAGVAFQPGLSELPQLLAAWQAIGREIVSGRQGDIDFGGLPVPPASARAGLSMKHDDEASSDYGAVVTKACDSSSFGDPAQRFSFNSVTGQLSTSYSTGGKKCVAVKGCALGADAEVVLTSCMDMKCTAWALQKPPHPASGAADPTWLVAPGSPKGQPHCLENPKKAGSGAVDIYCCSGATADCGSVYKTALPWQQWALSSNGQVKNLAGGNQCLSVTPPPPPPLTAAPVWPLPQYLHCQPDQDNEILLSDSVVVKVTGPQSAIADQAVARYTPLLRAAGNGKGRVKTVAIALQSGSEILGQTTNYSYSLSYVALGSNGLTGSVASPFGVGYALETLLQLAEPAAQAQCGSAFTVRDRPDYSHRGLMIDTGRRFYSVELVESLLEGMAMMKMNVLHMFLSELCFRVESKIFPDLVNNGGNNCTGPKPRPGLVNNGFYTQADIARLVEFAKRRGIRLIPEFDMPGHSGGFCHGLKSAGIKCCTNGGMGVPQIEDDLGGVSAGLVKQVLKEMAGLFPDGVMHIGGDETGSTAPCTAADTKSWEVKMIEYLLRSIYVPSKSFVLPRFWGPFMTRVYIDRIGTFKVRSGNK